MHALFNCYSNRNTGIANYYGFATSAAGPRPDNTIVFLFSVGKNLVLDWTIEDIFTEDHLNLSAVEADAAKTEESKHRMYVAPARAHKFESIVSSLSPLRAKGRCLIEATGDATRSIFS